MSRGADDNRCRCSRTPEIGEVRGDCRAEATNELFYVLPVSPCAYAPDIYKPGSLNNKAAIWATIAIDEYKQTSAATWGGGDDESRKQERGKRIATGTNSHGPKFHVL